MSGEIINKIDGFENLIFDLEFSKNGSYLAVALKGTGGVKLVEVSTWEVIKTLTGYGDSCNNVAFDGFGNLSTISYDGKLRLYDKSFNLIKNISLNGGKKPYSIAFSLDGEKIAVGYDDTTRIQVFSTPDLSTLYEPDVSNATDKYELSILAFSNDGEFLYAGGDYYLKKDDLIYWQIRRWRDAGEGNYIDISASLNTIMDIKVLPDNSIIVGGSEPDIELIDPYGNVLYTRKSDILSFTNSQFKYLKVNSDGTKIGFSPKNKYPLTFSLNDRLLSKEALSAELPVDSYNGVTMTDWKFKNSPKLNGTELKLFEKYERSNCVSVVDDYIVLGTNNNVYCLSSRGDLLWKVPAVAEVWAVNIASNNKVVIVAYDDGIIRWHRLSDGKKLLSLFVHDDAKRWILWSEKGYYDCYPTASELIGWNINNGDEKESYFYPISKFQTFYNPDIINQILISNDENDAIKKITNKAQNDYGTVQITNSLPPIVTIISPENNFESDTNEIVLSVKIDTPNDNPVLEIKTLVNARGYETERGLNYKKDKKNNTKKVTAYLTQKENIVSVIARNSFGWSTPSSIKIIRKDNLNDNEIKPKLSILSIGVSEYQKSEYSLGFASKDAKDFVKVFTDQKNIFYQDVQYKLLIDKDANKDNILKSLKWLEESTSVNDIALLFVSGHGMNDDNNELFYLPYEADIENLENTSLSTKHISETISNIKGKVIYFMDTCYSGNIRVEGRKIKKIDVNGAINDLASAQNGAIVFSSSTGNQVSLEKDEWGNGAFTKAITVGLLGNADFVKDGFISTKELDLFIDQEVKKLTNNKQSPITVKPDALTDFNLVKY